MRIGIDCRTILNPNGGERAGVGHYTANLVAELVKSNGNDELVLFFDQRDSSVASSYAGPNVAFRFFPRSRLRLPLLDSHLLPARTLAAERLDLLHGPANSVPLAYHGRSVITIHDLAIYKHPEWFPGGQFFSTKIAVPRSIAKAAGILAVSESTKADIVDLFDVAPEKVIVTPLGVNHTVYVPAKNRESVRQDVAKKYGLQGPYILFLGTLEPRKNIARLIAAFKAIKQEFDVHLIIAGGKGWLYENIFAEVGRLGLENDVSFTGYVSQEEKRALLQAAEAFVFPSLYEGFGLPVLEALACGTPVICSDSASLSEVGGDVPMYVDPGSVESIAQGIANVLGSVSEQERQRRSGPVQAEKFSWSKTAARTGQAYQVF